MSEHKTTNLPPPTPIALVLCDNVYRDSNGKQALIGLFNKIFASKFPAVHPRMCAYVSITSIRPNTVCSLDIINAETDVPVIEIQGPAPDNIGPTGVWEVVFELPPVSFPEAGQYYVRFLGSHHVLMQRPFDVLDIKNVNEGEKENE